MITVAEINDIERLDHFRLAWRDLLGKTRGATFAHSPEWLEHYWAHFGKGIKLRVLFVTLRNKIIGIVPLVVKPVATPLGTVRVLTYPLDNWGTFYGQIGGNSAATMVSAIRHIRSTRRDWDLIDLRYVDQEGHDHRRTANALKSVGYQGSSAPWRRLSLVDTCDTSWIEYLASRSPEAREHIQRSEEITARDGHVSFYRSRLEDPLAPGWNPRWDLWSQFEQMDFRHGNQTLIAGGAHTLKQKLDFLRDIHGPASRSGMARIDALFVNHRVVAFAYGLQHTAGTDYLAIGRAPDTNPETVTTLISNMIQQSILDGEPGVNLSLLSPSAASLWQNSVRHSYRCSHYPLTVPRSQLLRLNRWMQQPVASPKANGSPAMVSDSQASREIESSIELAAIAPEDWPEENTMQAEPDSERPPFRIVG